MKKQNFLITVILAMVLFLSGCGSSSPAAVGGGTGGASTNPIPAVTITAIINNNASNNVHIILSDNLGAPIHNASLTVNGMLIPENLFQGYGMGTYDGTVVIAPGGNINVAVIANGTTYIISDTQFTVFPDIITPASGTIWSASIANTVIWSSAAPIASGAFYSLSSIPSGTMPLPGTAISTGTTSYIFQPNTLNVIPTVALSANINKVKVNTSGQASGSSLWVIGKGIGSSISVQ